MIAFFDCVKPRRDNKEKCLKWTENVAFNHTPPLIVFLQLLRAIQTFKGVSTTELIFLKKLEAKNKFLFPWSQYYKLFLW